MEQRTELTSLNPTLQIAWKGWRAVYLRKPAPHRLFSKVYKGNLVYRAAGSSKRISYTQIKKGRGAKENSRKRNRTDWL